MVSQEVAALSAEFTGTFLLVFTVGCNVLSGSAVWGGVSIACVLMVSIYALGDVSGANFNPAVSLTLGLVKALGCEKGLDWPVVGKYCAVQLVAGILAGFCYFALFANTFNLGPAQGHGAVSVGICEILYTFVLCFVVCNVAVAKGAEGRQYYGLAIGFVIIAGAYGAGHVSGGCFNPAVAFGIDVSSAHMGIGWCLVYTVYEFLGAAMAAGLFMVVRPGDFNKEGTNPMIAKLTSEFLGTFVLVLTVGLNVLGHSQAGAFSIAASLMCMVYALGDVSGAHFNPAVTTAILCSGRSKINGMDAVKYVFAQLVGALLAGATYAIVHKGFTFPLGPGTGFSWGQVAIAEVVFTFVLCYVVLAVATTREPLKDFFGLAIGSCVTVGGFAIGGVSGGSLNPAVSVGIAGAHIFGGGFFYKALIYSVFEVVGGVLAAGLFFVTHQSEYSSLPLAK